MKEITPEKALERLEDMCARAEHCTGEIVQKLRQWGIAPADANNIIKSLIAKRFVDDSRFASAYARDKLRFAGWGPRKIAMGLAAKRVDKGIVAETVAELDHEEVRQQLDHALQAKLRTSPDLLSTYEGRTKLYRFALQRGFDSAAISSAIKAKLKATGCP